MGKGGLLVLDNFQEIGDDTPTHRALAVAFEELPEGIGILVASRAEPPAAYLPLVARERVAFLDAHEIRLTREETEGIVEARADLDRAVVNALHEKCDGWAAGLTLLLERARRGESIDPGRGADALAALFGHFADELMAHEFERDSDSLIALSVLPRRIRPPVARALTGNDHVDSILERLHRRNLFTVRRGSGADVSYEFHNLLRAHLRSRGRETWPRERWREALTRAATLLKGDGSLESAAALYQGGLNDWDAMAGVVLSLATHRLAGAAAHPRGPDLGHPAGEPRTASVDPLLARRRPGLRGSTRRAHVARARARRVRRGQRSDGPPPLGERDRVHPLPGDRQPRDARPVDRRDAAAPRRGRHPAFAAFELHVQSSLLFATAFRRPEVERTTRIAARINALLDMELGPTRRSPRHRSCSPSSGGCRSRPGWPWSHGCRSRSRRPTSRRPTAPSGGCRSACSRTTAAPTRLPPRLWRPRSPSCGTTA